MGPARPEPTSLRVSLINGTGTVWVLYCMVWVWVKGQNVVWVSDEHVAESPKLGGVIATP